MGEQEQRRDVVEEYRSATANAALGLSAFLALKPEIKATVSWAKDKITDKPSGVVLPRRDIER